MNIDRQIDSQRDRQIERQKTRTFQHSENTQKQQIKPTITNKKKIPEENSHNKPLTPLREVDQIQTVGPNKSALLVNLKTNYLGAKCFTRLKAKK